MPRLCGSAAATVIDQPAIPGFTPYEGRLYFIARSGGESADHDVDNVYVQHLNEGETAVAVNEYCVESTETYNNFDQPGEGTHYSPGFHLYPNHPQLPL